MKLFQIVAKDFLRRQRRILYTALGVAIGVAVVVAVATVASGGKSKVYEELDKYGPNLMVMPEVSDVDLQLGDLRLGALAVGENYISQDKLKSDELPMGRYVERWASRTRKTLPLLPLSSTSIPLCWIRLLWS